MFSPCFLTSSSTRVGFLLVAVTSVTTGLGGPLVGSEPTSDLSAQLTKILSTQVDAWNRGDIDSFMQAYWKSEKLTFSSGGNTTRGWEATRKRYHRRYPNKAQMGQLRFSELEVQPLGQKSALVLGRWALKKDEPAGGNFSLVWKRIEGNWVIIHDHSSANE